MLTIPEARTLLRRNRPQRNCDGYPAEVRSATTALARTLMEEGRSCTNVARQLGLAATTLTRWLDEAPTRERASSAGFVPVLLPPPSHREQEAGLAVVSPGGYRVEGLDLDGVVTLLSRLK